MSKLDLINETDRNEMSQLIANCDFDNLGPAQRAVVADLVLKQSMAEDLYEIRRWFENSKLFDGIPDMPRFQGKGW